MKKFFVYSERLEEFKSKFQKKSNYQIWKNQIKFKYTVVSQDFVVIVVAVGAGMDKAAPTVD